MVENQVRPTVANLKNIKLLSPLTEQELAKLITVGTPLKTEAHANIVIEGELSWGLFLLLDGVVSILKTNKLSGNIYDVGQLRSGSFFGEMSLIDDNPRSATVKALTDCQLFYISKEKFLEYLGQSPGLKLRFYESCIHTLVTRLRELDDNYVISQYQLWKAAMRKEAA